MQLFLSDNSIFTWTWTGDVKAYCYFGNQENIIALNGIFVNGSNIHENNMVGDLALLDIYPCHDKKKIVVDICY